LAYAQALAVPGAKQRFSVGRRQIVEAAMAATLEGVGGGN